MIQESAFRADIKRRFEEFLVEAQSSLTSPMRIDLHCHDRNSDVPDETLGRMLGLPETWLPTDDLVATLRRRGGHAITITNHNNARSCFELQDRGEDVLVGAEFSCTLPELNLGLHVLAYGFTPAEEQELLGRRKNLYRFLEYARARDLPTILAHPLDFHCKGDLPDLEKFERLLLLFDTFEVVNGQRDSWQNLLVATWVGRATPEHLDAIARRAGIGAGEFVSHPYRKRMVGGSDDHFGVFAGGTGTLLELPESLRSCDMKPSERALLALRRGRTAPFGSWNDGEKLNLALLDYFSQIAMHMKDPGLVHILLHRGTGSERALAIGIANAMSEIRRHRRTMTFLGTFHDALRGQGPSRLKRLFVPRHFAPILSAIDRLSESRRGASAGGEMELSIDALFLELNRMLAQRLSQKSWPKPKSTSDGTLGLVASLLGHLDLPSDLRSLFVGKGDGGARGPKLSELLDGLSFPFLASAVVAGSAFASTRVLHGRRSFKARLARNYSELRAPERALWLTDTIDDNNGVSRVLVLLKEELALRGLPVDLLACGSGPSESHLHRVKPVVEFSPPFYSHQSIRVPNLLEIRRVMELGSYDRVVCSTEGPMALMALFLKHAFNVPAYFYVHTDWLAFAREKFSLDEAGLDNLRRVLRAFYDLFDGVFVLNSEQEELFTGPAMGLARDKVHRTGHWVGKAFERRPVARDEVLPGVPVAAPVLLYAGRLSEEKGVLELPAIWAAARAIVPDVALVVAGSGPAEEKLRSLLPGATFLGWVSEPQLAKVYSAADLLLLPSRFDTFGCVVIEAMACGLPVCAYDTKGPRDIIEHGISGFLASDSESFRSWVREFLARPNLSMKAGAMRRARDFSPTTILPDLLSRLGLESFVSAMRKKEEFHESCFVSSCSAVADASAGSHV